MIRLIPKKSKVQAQFYKNFTVSDAVMAFVALLLVALILISTLSFKWYLAGGVALMFIIMMITTAPDTRLYQSIGYLFRYMFGTRNYKRQRFNSSKSVNSLMPYSDILDDGLIDYKGYFAGVVEINPVEFYMLSEDRQNVFINAVDNALKSLSTEQTAMIVKLPRPMVLDDYINSEERKIEDIKIAAKNGKMSFNEMTARIEVVQTRINGLKISNVDSENSQNKDRYFFVLFGSTRITLRSGLEFVKNTLEAETSSMLSCKILNQQETAVFLKNTYFNDVDEREIKDIDPKDYMQWIMPDTIKFGASNFTIDEKVQKIYTVADYPVSVPNSWGSYFFGVPDTKIVVKFRAVPQGEAERRLDKAIMEMQIQLQKRGKASVSLEKDTHLNTLQELLISLKNGNEVLFDTNIFVTTSEESKKSIKAALRRGNFKFNEMFGIQKEAFINSNIAQRSTLKKFERGINSQSLSAIFPFVSEGLQDPKGIFIGNNSEPFFIDFFARGGGRVNSNMIVFGKSGSGKSFAVSGLLTHLAAGNSKIFVCDPENEYSDLAKNLGGKIVDVGSAKQGRINPFHVVVSLDDEDGIGENVSLSTHMQFLEEFFSVILEGITRDALEILNECVKEVYKKFGITDKTDIRKMKPKDFPIFQDLFEFVEKKYDKEKDSYMKNNLKIIRTYLLKFAEGGRNSTLWNGYSTITSDENFIDFNFQSLLSNKNDDIANAQMLLIMRWLENEIFKNRDYNKMYNTNRKVVIAIDEAHTFIDPKKPVALDFMFNLAKRIRKYDGMQIVISQNIKDFVGSPDIARKSTAIINASQYSMIFGLAPSDINDLVSLYEKSGQINETEQQTIVGNQLGQAFMITSPYSRTNIRIVYAENIRLMFKANRVDEKGNFIPAEEFEKIKAEKEARAKEEREKEAEKIKQLEENAQNQAKSTEPAIETKEDFAEKSVKVPAEKMTTNKAKARKVASKQVLTKKTGAKTAVKSKPVSTSKAVAKKITPKKTTTKKLSTGKTKKIERK